MGPEVLDSQPFVPLEHIPDVEQHKDVGAVVLGVVLGIAVVGLTVEGAVVLGTDVLGANVWEQKCLALK